MRFERVLPTRLALILLSVPVALGTSCAFRGHEPPIIEVVGPAPASPADGILRIATANLWGVSVLGFDGARAVDTRFEAFAERLSKNEAGLHVVLIQEAWKDAARRRLLAHPGVSAEFPHRVDVVARPGGAGLVVLSRLPLESARFYRYRAQGNCLKFWEADCIGGKGLVLVRARLGDRSIWMGNTHLIACYARDEDAPRACDEDDPNGLDRWHQLAELRQVVADLVGDQPVLVAGDFNFTRSSRYYASMTDVRPSPTPNRPASTPPASRAWLEFGESPASGRGLDFIFTRPGERVRWQAIEPTEEIFEAPVELPDGESRPLSDHPILAGTFCLVRAGEATATCVPATSTGSEPRP